MKTNISTENEEVLKTVLTQRRYDATEGKTQ